jgi:hypothetical protein
MKKNYTLAIFLMLIIPTMLLPGSSTYGGDHKTKVYHANFADNDQWGKADLEIDVEGGSIIITEEGKDYPRVEITDDYKLFINDERIELDKYQEMLVRDFHVQFFEMVDYGKFLGIEGAKIGLSGAKLGIKAIGRLLKMLFTDYNEDDFERDMEDDADKLEARADELEKKAEVIEDMADELERIAEEMVDEIPALAKLGWL